MVWWLRLLSQEIWLANKSWPLYNFDKGTMFRSKFLARLILFTTNSIIFNINNSLIQLTVGFHDRYIRFAYPVNGRNMMTMYWIRAPSKIVRKNNLYDIKDLPFVAPRSIETISTFAFISWHGADSPIFTMNRTCSILT